MTTITMAAERYVLSMRLMHWLMAVCILGALLLGFFWGDLPGALRVSALRLHKSLGMTVVLLLPLRILLRNLTPMPVYSGVSRVQHQLMLRVHQLMYVAMGLVAGSGYVMIAAKGKAIAWFGVEIPSLIAQNLPLARLARSLHEPAAYLLVALLVLHMAGLLKHALIDAINPLKPMI